MDNNVLLLYITAFSRLMSPFLIAQIGTISLFMLISLWMDK